MKVNASTVATVTDRAEPLFRIEFSWLKRFFASPDTQRALGIYN